MPNPEPEAAVPGGRIPTGNPSLDEILNGGLVGNRPYLIVGPSGTGKTKLALQFLCEGVRRGEKVLLVTLEDPPNEMRVNHRALLPELDQVFVFDAIPDVMRYERAPFKDIAAVRSAVPFAEVGDEIRKTQDLVSVEVTFTALEQTLKMEIARRKYSRLVIDSLTALQYFCMKGIDETVGAQTFLRFLSDLRITTLLTVESPVEEVETAERLLARGEIRLFRWELEGRTVRAIGVEKFRGSPHDVRLRPYRISSTGLDIDLATTISRDTRMIQTPSLEAIASASPRPSTDLGQVLSDINDLATVGLDVEPIRAEVAAVRDAARDRRPADAALHLVRARALLVELAQAWNPSAPGTLRDPETSERVRILAAQGSDARAGSPPIRIEIAPPHSELPPTQPPTPAPTPPSGAVEPIPPIDPVPVVPQAPEISMPPEPAMGSASTPTSPPPDPRIPDSEPPPSAPPPSDVPLPAPASADELPSGPGDAGRPAPVDHPAGGSTAPPEGPPPPRPPDVERPPMESVRAGSEPTPPSPASPPPPRIVPLAPSASPPLPSRVQSPIPTLAPEAPPTPTPTGDSPTPTAVAPPSSRPEPTPLTLTSSARGGGGTAPRSAGRSPGGRARPPLPAMRPRKGSGGRSPEAEPVAATAPAPSGPAPAPSSAEPLAPTPPSTPAPASSTRAPVEAHAPRAPESPALPAEGIAPSAPSIPADAAPSSPGTEGVREVLHPPETKVRRRTTRSASRRTTPAPGGDAASPKAKRRPSRSRKAPPVTSAEPGTPPPELLTNAPPANPPTAPAAAAAGSEGADAGQAPVPAPSDKPPTEPA